MADISNLSQFLTDVATAIREKKGTEEQIPAVNFDTEIASIETGIDTSDATVTPDDITINKVAYAKGKKVVGTLPLFPNSRTFTVDGGVTNDAENNRIQISTINSTKQTLDSNLNMEFNGAYSDVANAVGLTPEKLVKGNTVLGVEGTAEAGGTTINNQDKTIISNGQYTADEGYTGLGTVTVQVPQEGGKGDVKLFETEEEMQADSTAKEGDLAVVYREEIQNMTADTQTQYITFPETVTLPEAFTGDVFCILRAVDETIMFDGQVMLNQSMFDFNGYSETGMIRVNYQSEDGITYTRQEFMGDSGALTNPVDLGVVIGVYSSEEWNDMLGYFMQAGGNVFDGLYQAKEGLDYNYIYGLGNIVSSDDATYTENTLVEVSNVIDAILENSELGINTLCFKMNNILYVLRNMNKLYNIVGETGFRLQSQHGNSEQNIECVTINMDTLEVTQSPLTIDTNYAFINGDTKWYMSFDVFNNIDYAFVLYGDSDGNIHASNINIRTLENNTLNYTTVVDFTCYFKSFITYKLANNQFTLTSPNQLLPSISAYGKNGNVIGDDSIYDNLDYSLVLSTVGIDPNQLEPIASVPMEESKGLNVYIESGISDFDSVQLNILNEVDRSVINKPIAKVLGNEDASFISNESIIELNNGNKLMCLLHKVNNSTGNRCCTMFILSNDFSEVVNSVELATNSNRLKTLEYLFTDEYIYVIIGGYVPSTYYWYVSKISREDGTVIKSASTTSNMLADNSSVYVSWYNGVLIYGKDNDRCKNCGIIHFTSELEIDLNTSVSISGGDDINVGVSPGVIVDDNFYCTLSGRTLPDLVYHRKLIKISGTTVTNKDISSYVSSTGISCDENYIYAPNDDYCTKFDTNMNAVSTTEKKSYMYHNLKYMTLSFVDYLNYTVYDIGTGDIYIITDGNLEHYEPTIQISGFYTNCYNANIDDLVWNSAEYLNKYILSKGITYTKKTRFPISSEGDIILITTIHKYLCSVYRRINNMDIISSEEYNTALNTSEQILGEEETINE